MYQFIDGAFAATTAGAVWVAVWNYLQRKRAAEAHAQAVVVVQSKCDISVAQQRAARDIIGAEVKTLEAWTKHLDEEAKVDYTALVARLKHLSQ